MALHDILFSVAAALCVLVGLGHELAGSHRVLVPLANAGIGDSVIWLNHFSWHVGTVAVCSLAALFLFAVWHPAGAVFAIIASVIATILALLALALAVFGNPVLWQTPAPYPWLPIAVLGFTGAQLSRSAL